MESNQLKSSKTIRKDLNLQVTFNPENQQNWYDAYRQQELSDSELQSTTTIFISCNNLCSLENDMERM